MFSEPAPRLSHFDQERLVPGIRLRAALLEDIAPHTAGSALWCSCSAGTRGFESRSHQMDLTPLLKPLRRRLERNKGVVVFEVGCPSLRRTRSRTVASRVCSH